MSLPNSVNAPVEKQHTNVYTMMLILAFIFIITSCVVLYMELQRFDPYWWNTSSAAPSATPQMPAPLNPGAAAPAPAPGPAPVPAPMPMPMPAPMP